MCPDTSYFMVSKNVYRHLIEVFLLEISHRKVSIYKEHKHRRKHRYIRAPSWIQTHDFSVGVADDNTRL